MTIDTPTPKAGAELLPCPCCNSRNWRIEICVTCSNVRCIDCGVYIERGWLGNGDTDQAMKERAIAAWNSRAQPQAERFERWCIVSRDGEPRAIGTDPNDAWENFCMYAFGGDYTESRVNVAKGAGKKAVPCTITLPPTREPEEG